MPMIRLMMVLTMLMMVMMMTKGGYVVACEEESTGLFLELCERASKVGTQQCADESDEDD